MKRCRSKRRSRKPRRRGGMYLDGLTGAVTGAVLPVGLLLGQQYLKERQRMQRMSTRRKSFRRSRRF